MPIREEIVITADNKTARAFRDVQRASRKTGESISAVSRTMAGVALAGAAAAAGLYLLTKRAIENADAIGKAADSMGINVETLQEYRYAAELSGVATEQLDSALQAFTKRLGEAQAGTGTLVTFLQKYDKALLDTVQSADSTDEALDAILEGMANAATAADRAALASAAFGRTAGVQMANLVRDGTTGLAEMREEAQRLGLVLDEDAVRGAERANDALFRMERIVGVNLQRVLVSLAPTIEQIGIAFGEAAPSIAAAADAVIEFFFGVEALSLQGLEREIAAVDEEINQLARDAVTFMDIESEMAGAGAVLETATANQTARLQELRAELVKLRDEREKEIEQRKRLFEDTGDGTVDETVEKEKERAAAWIEQINETYDRVSLTEEELINRQTEQQLAKLKEFQDKKLISEMDYLEAEGALYSTAFLRKLELEEKLTEEKQRQLDERQRAEEAAARLQERIERQRFRAQMNILSDLSSLMNSHSRKAFEVGKAAAISQTIIQTLLGAQESYTALASIPIIGPALGAAAAAAALAAGYARVQAIKSTSFNGGGGISAGSGGGVSAPSPSTPDVPLLPPTQQQPAARELNLTIVGHSITAEQMRDEFIPLFNEAAEDGVPIKINATVANS